MMKNFSKLAILLILLVFISSLSPVPAYALCYIDSNDGLGPQSVPCSPTSTSRILCTLATTNAKVGDVLNYATCIISHSVIPLIFALAVVSFVWGVVQYVINSDDETKKTKGRDFMIWGIVALAVMVSVWGLVRILGNTFGINTNFIPQVRSQ